MGNPYITDGETLSHILEVDYILDEEGHNNIKNLMIMSVEVYKEMLLECVRNRKFDDFPIVNIINDTIRHWADTEFDKQDWNALYEANKHLEN